MGRSAGECRGEAYGVSKLSEEYSCWILQLSRYLDWGAGRGGGKLHPPALLFLEKSPKDPYTPSTSCKIRKSVSFQVSFKLLLLCCILSPFLEASLECLVQSFSRGSETVLPYRRQCLASLPNVRALGQAGKEIFTCGG